MRAAPLAEPGPAASLRRAGAGRPEDRSDAAIRVAPARRSGQVPGPEERERAARVGLVVFLAAEAMLFAGLVAAYLVLRLGAPGWPPPLQPRLPQALSAANTALLVASLWPLRRARAALRRGDPRGVRRGLGAAGTLGAAFLGLQGVEWVRLLAFGLRASDGVYGGLFYLTVGAHGVHVLGAVGWLLGLRWAPSVTTLSPRGAVRVNLAGTYWTFVVALWPIIYVLLYLA